MNLFILNVQGRTELTNSAGSISLICSALNASQSFTNRVIDEANDLITCPMASSKMAIGGAETYKMFKLPLIDIMQFDRFTDVYFNELDSTWSSETHKHDIGFTFRTMQEAFARGTYGKDTLAIKNTCKVLKIKHTYKAINTFLSGAN